MCHVMTTERPYSHHGTIAHAASQDEHSIAAKRSLEAMVELYRRRVWTDARTVNVIASACLSQVGSTALSTIWKVKRMTVVSCLFM